MDKVYTEKELALDFSKPVEIVLSTKLTEEFQRQLDKVMDEEDLLHYLPQMTKEV